MTTNPDAKLIEQGRKLFAGDWQFIWASPSVETLPPMQGIEVADSGGVRRPLQCRQIQPDQRADRPQRAGAHLAYARPHPGTDLLRRPAGSRLPAGRYARLWLCVRAQSQGRVLDPAYSQIPAGSQQPG